MVNTYCRLISGNFSVGLQVFIALMASLSLLYKYLVFEKPRRKYEIFLMDVSKQGVSSMLIHFWNICQSIQFSKSLSNQINQNGDECANYFMFFALDTFLGIYITYVILLLVHKVSLTYNIVSIKYQGYYGHPLKYSWYYQQLIVFILAIVISKSCLGFIMYWLSNEANLIATILFEPFKSFDPDVELIFVMVICPFFLSIIQVITLPFN